MPATVTAEPRPWKLRAPCQHCGGLEGTIQRAGPNLVVRCGNRGCPAKWSPGSVGPTLYIASKAEIGEARAWPCLPGQEPIDPATATPAERRAHYHGLLEIAAERGYAPGWAAHVFKASFGDWPPAEEKPETEKRPDVTRGAGGRNEMPGQRNTSTLRGTIEQAYVSTTFEPPKACFKVKLNDGQVVIARHKLDEANKAKNLNGFRSLGLAYPSELEKLPTVAGREVEVRSSDYQGKRYFFLGGFDARQGLP